MASTLNVRIQQTKDRFRLLVDDEPYYIHGAGINDHDYQTLVDAGGNSVRNWSVSEAEARLDRAQALGLTLSLNLPLQPQRHGFSYRDKRAVKDQFSHMLEHVEAFRGHPALLCWILGNELNLSDADPIVYDKVNELSHAIHDLDRNHLVTTTLAGSHPRLIASVRERAADLDFLSIQLYGSISKLPHYSRTILEGIPFAVTEWGPLGHWESPTTDWHAPIEENSSQKAARMIHAYRNYMTDLPNMLGSYVFYWEQKQERTPTWYSMFTREGVATAAVDAMELLWTGKLPKKRSPRIEGFTLNQQKAASNIRLSRTSVAVGELSAKDLDGGRLTYQWSIKPESTATSEGGDYEEDIPDQGLMATQSHENRIKFTTPNKVGDYRLFVFVFNETNRCGHANIPFQVID